MDVSGSIVDGEDYYTILQIDPGAAPQEVKAAYKSLALRYHPDRSGDPEATQRMQALNAAFEVLGDPEKRAGYDREREADARSAAPSAPSEQPVDPVRPQPARPVSAEGQAQFRAWLREQLALIFRLLLMTMLLFVLSLFSGQVSVGGILLLVLISLSVIFSIVRRIRNPAV